MTAQFSDLKKGFYFTWTGWGQPAVWRQIKDFAIKWDDPTRVIIQYFSETQQEDLVKTFYLGDITVSPRPMKKKSGFGLFCQVVDKKYPLRV